MVIHHSQPFIGNGTYDDDEAVYSKIMFSAEDKNCKIFLEKPLQ